MVIILTIVVAEDGKIDVAANLGVGAKQIKENQIKILKAISQVEGSIQDALLAGLQPVPDEEEQA